MLALFDKFAAALHVRSAALLEAAEAAAAADPELAEPRAPAYFRAASQVEPDQVRLR